MTSKNYVVHRPEITGLPAAEPEFDHCEAGCVRDAG
jgi:hypothetical protein